jgi:hypothetical protein
MKKNGKSVVTPILATLISIGPIGWHIVHIFNNENDRLLLTFGWSIFASVFTTVLWMLYFKK